MTDIEQARRRGCSRSPKTFQLIEAKIALKLDEARGIAITDSDPEKKINSRLAYARRIAGRILSMAN